MPNKISFIEKIFLRLQFPKIPKEKFVKIKISEYELMKKMSSKIKNYITQIQEQNKEINDLKEKIKDVESKRKKNASKIGGLQTKLNNEIKKNLLLQKIITENQETIKLQEAEIGMLKNKGKRKKDIESYKNYFQTRKELEKREKGS